MTTINVNYTIGGEPDMACTYYDDKTQPHHGTCEESTEKGKYSCRADDDTTRVEPQSGCEWKVKRMDEYQRNKLSAATIQTPAP